MLKLSIVIPAHDERLMEASLVAILPSRPRDCEIIVVHDEGYDDPYDLAGEVSFVAVPPASTRLARLGRGLAACRAAVAHVLECGAEVVEGWSEPALVHFRDRAIAAVAPVVLDRDQARVASAGLAYRRGGVRVACRRGEPAAAIALSAAPTLGPTLSAAFYRVSALEALADPLSETVGEPFADVELALRLATAGYRAVCEPRSRVIAAPSSPKRSPLAEGWFAERLFWRHAKAQGLARSTIAHVGVLTAELARTAVRPWEAGRIVGRIAGSLEWLARGRRIAIPVSPASQVPHRASEPAPAREPAIVAAHSLGIKRRRDTSRV